MANDTDDQEKTEAASPRRLEKAREEGQVARSRELTTFLLLAGGIAGLWTTGGIFYARLGLVLEHSFMFERSQAFEVELMLEQAGWLAQIALLALMPLFMLMLMLALTAPLLLGGWLFSANSLQPQLGKLNPIKGLGRIFSGQALAELGKVLVKAVLIGSVITYFLRSRIGEFLALMEQPVQQAFVHALELAVMACALMVASLLIVIFIDVPYQLWTHAKKLRMSKEELVREHKESDGDPQMKSRIRSLQQAMARKRMMSKVPSADVIVTNPTHYAVALRYEQNRMVAPRVVAKGADAVAARIRELGREHGVPLLEAAPLARALYRHVDLDREIPADLYTAVAEVLAWAFSLRRSGAGEAVLARPVDLPVPTALDAGI